MLKHDFTCTCVGGGLGAGHGFISFPSSSHILTSFKKKDVLVQSFYVLPFSFMYYCLLYVGMLV